MNRIAAILCLLLFLSVLPATSADKSQGYECSFTNDEHFPNCIQRSRSGHLFIPRRFLKNVSFNKYGLAEVWSREEGFMYANKEGAVIVRGVARMEIGADPFRDGLVRVKAGAKWGFADRKGRMVVPAIYDGAMWFEKGFAEVCKGCSEECSPPGHCEHRTFANGEWFRINTRGEIVAKIKSPFRQ